MTFIFILLIFLFIWFTTHRSKEYFITSNMIDQNSIYNEDKLELVKKKMFKAVTGILKKYHTIFWVDDFNDNVVDICLLYKDLHRLKWLIDRFHEAGYSIKQLQNSMQVYPINGIQFRDYNKQFSYFSNRIGQVFKFMYPYITLHYCNYLGDKIHSWKYSGKQNRY